MSSGVDQRRVSGEMNSRSVDGWKYRQEISRKSGRWRQTREGVCAQERTRVMGEEMSETGGEPT